MPTLSYLLKQLANVSLIAAHARVVKTLLILPMHKSILLALLG